MTKGTQLVSVKSLQYLNTQVGGQLAISYNLVSSDHNQFQRGALIR